MSIGSFISSLLGKPAAVDQQIASPSPSTEPAAQTNTFVAAPDARPQAEALAQAPNQTEQRTSQVIAAELQTVQKSLEQVTTQAQEIQAKVNALKAELQQVQAQEAAALQTQQIMATQQAAAPTITQVPVNPVQTVASNPPSVAATPVITTTTTNTEEASPVNINTSAAGAPGTQEPSEAEMNAFIEMLTGLMGHDANNNTAATAQVPQTTVATEQK